MSIVARILKSQTVGTGLTVLTLLFLGGIVLFGAPA